MSVKENKNIYFQRREELKLTREQASRLLDTISEDRIEKIENGKQPYPEEVVTMAEKYRMPELCHHYCTRECAIGSRSMPEIEIRDLSQIVLEAINSLNVVNRARDRLVEITVDGQVTDDELRDFAAIQSDLAHISLAAEALKLWTDRMIASGVIDAEALSRVKKEQGR